MPGVDAPSGLLVDLRRQPLGIACRDFRFSWIVPTLVPGARQTAYQVQVSVRAGRWATDGLVWDSGRIDGDASVAVRYGGPALEPASPYWWRVRTWVTGVSQQERRSAWSSPQLVITEASSTSSIGEPIWASSDPLDSVPSAPDWCLLRHEFDLPEVPIEAAFVQASGQSPLGACQYVYKLWLNGAVVGRGPVRAVADEVRYHTHEVTSVLRPGRNAIAALCYSASDHRFAARLVVCFADGSRRVVASSPGWRAQPGSALLPFHGFTEGGYFEAPQEYWDLRHEPVGWTAAGFDDGSWPVAAGRDRFERLAAAAVDIEACSVQPASVTERSPGVWIVDLGGEIVGGLRVAIEGRAGTALSVRLGEELDGGRVRSHLRTGNIYEEVWTLRDGRQEIEHWGHRGFRWAELVAPTGMIPTVTGVALHAPWDEHDSAFDCSDPDLTAVWELARYSVKALDLDLYQDTHTRERRPYEGDALINQRSDYAVQRQFALARYSNTYLCWNPSWPTEFHLMSALCAWEDYLATGDPAQLEHDYPSLVAKNFDHDRGADGLVHKEPGATSGYNTDVVDWPPSCRDGYVFSDCNTVVNAFQYAAYAALARIATVLDRPADAATYTEAATGLRAAINARLLAPEATSYVDGPTTTHCAQQATAFPVALGVAETEDLPRLGKFLADGGMRCSPYAAQFLLDALFRAGRADAAYALMVGTGLRSWLHMIRELGATTTMECWDPSLKPNTTFSHVWGSSPVNVIARYLLGVQVVSPGAARLEVHPQPGPLRWVEGTVPTIRGPVSVRVERDPDLRVQLTTPANTTTRLVLDGRDLGVHPDALTVHTEGPSPVRTANGPVAIFDDIAPGVTTVTG